MDFTFLDAAFSAAVTGSLTDDRRVHHHAKLHFRFAAPTLVWQKPLP
jgi:hypothetical protein